MGKIGLIISREYYTRVRKKSFIIMTILGPLLIGGFLTLTIWLSISENQVQTVLVCDPGQLTTNELRENGNVKFRYTDKLISKEEFIANEQYTLMLEINGSVLNGTPPLLLYKELPSVATINHITNQYNNRLESLRLSKIDATPDQKEFFKEEYYKIKKPVDITLKDAATDEDGREKQILWGVGFSFSILIYMFIFLYGVQVMRGVIEEKTSRIIEVIVTSVRPFQLMMGKIIGVALVGLTQFLLWVALTFAILFVVKSTFFSDFYDPTTIAAQGTTVASGVDPTAEAPVNFQANAVFMAVFYGIDYPLILGLFIFYFLGGYLLYSALFAAVGAAVDSESDTQQFMLPITLPLVFGFIIAQLAINNPDSNVVFWTSIIPLTSPVVMMVRVAMGAPVWEIALSMGLLIIGFIFCTWLAGRIYRTGILMYGKKVSYKELWKWLFYKG